MKTIRKAVCVINTAENYPERKVLNLVFCTENRCNILKKVNTNTTSKVETQNNK